MGVTSPLGSSKLACTSATFGIGSPGWPASAKQVAQRQEHSTLPPFTVCLLCLHWGLFPYIKKYFSGTQFMASMHKNVTGMVPVPKDTDA